MRKAVFVPILIVLFSSTALMAQGVEPAGWYAGDMHAHRSCGGSPDSVTSIFSKMDNENISSLALLADMGNAEVQNATTDLPLVNGQDAISSGGRSCIGTRNGIGTPHICSTPIKP